ncbi:MAG: hypothetical protein A2Y64_04910 [Candidatus Coatesbacteria bacterium RBG_13_66_14]|uniref:Uncharacterized protein n=1 Tax=Candidatus Coatesbacteria bacterium RBG_13_66_14 TaxID=1817816 RepID=A0A1F5F6D7_9BACT|nr:MAG: hypothetical protein A2Y64_04910 [Candidatus Coatesbacteria bacterium RBG_13_66_14]
MKYVSVILCALAVVCLGAAVNVDYHPTDTVQLYTTQDTWIWTGYGPYGSSGELRINQDSSYDQRPVLQWDVSSLDGYIINSATFYVYRYQGSSTLTGSVYRVTESWVEATLVAPLAHDGDTVWATGDAGDPNGWKTYDVTDLVQAWTDGDYDNYGLLCKGAGSGYYQRWCSKEYGSNAPYLDIDYTVVIPDTTPPFVSNMEPTDGASDMPIDTDIVFHCEDDESGVDVATIDFTVQDTSLASGDNTVSPDSHSASVGCAPAGDIPGTLVIDDGDLLDVICTFTPDDLLPYEDTITCTVDGALADLEANEMGDDFVWTFGTEEEPPNVVNTTWGVIKADF